MRAIPRLACRRGTAYFVRMKHLLLLLSIGLTGCWLTVNSRNPFYTEATRVTVPAAVGEWDAPRTSHTDLRPGADATWTLAAGSPMRLRVYTDSGDGTGTVVFFQVTGKMYCDMVAFGDPYHHLYRADLAGSQLQLAALDGNWLTNAIALGRVDLPALGSNSEINATAPQWVAFLEHLGTNTTTAFGNEISLTRCAHYNFVPARRLP